MIKKDIYEPAEMELVLFDTEDVITTSTAGDIEEPDADLEGGPDE